jgi:hypothetical protein
MSWAALIFYALTFEHPLSFLASTPAECYADHPIFAGVQLALAAVAGAFAIRAGYRAVSSHTDSWTAWDSVGLGLLALAGWGVFLLLFWPDPVPLTGKCPPAAFE